MVELIERLEELRRALFMLWLMDDYDIDELESIKAEILDIKEKIKALEDYEKK